MPLYVEQCGACGRLEIAYRTYQTELKRLLRRQQNLMRGPFRRRDLRTTSDYGLGSSVIEQKHIGNCPITRGIGVSWMTIPASVDHKSSMFAGVTMIGADEDDYSGRRDGAGIVDV
jgi:hypothetical protein